MPKIWHFRGDVNFEWPLTYMQLVLQFPVRGKLKYMGPGLNSLSRFSENLRNHRIKWRMEVTCENCEIFLPYVTHTCGDIKTTWAMAISWPYFIAWLALLLEISNTCIAIIYFPVCDIINFEITLSFLIKQFFNITKKVRTKN